MTKLPPTDALHQTKWAHVKKNGIALHIADMDFQTCPSVLNELKKVNSAGVFSYAWPSDQLKEAIVSYFSKNNWFFKKEALSFVPGLVSGIDIVLRALLKPGDEMIVLTPEYPMIMQVAKLHPVTCLQVPLMEGNQNGCLNYSINIQAISQAITTKTRLILFSNPHNPTGTLFCKQDLIKLASLCLKHNILIVADEIWSDIILEPFEFRHVGSLSKEISNNTISLVSPTKTYNLAGLTGGMIVCSNDKIRQRIEQYCLVHLPVQAYVAFAKLYQSDGKWLDQKLEYFKQAKVYLTQFFNTFFPDFLICQDPATYLLWLKTPYQSTESWLNKLEQEQGVKLSAGRNFGDGFSAYFRLTYATPLPVLKQACERMKTLFHS